MNNEKRLYAVLAVACVANLAAHLFFYPALPEVVATHWGGDGHVDGWSPKQVTLILDVLPLAMLGILAVSPRLDPRGSAYEKFGGLWHAFVAATVLFIAAITWLSELSSFGVISDGSSFVGVFVCGVVGVGFVALGNYLPRARQNYSFGVKTPWALHDEVVWDRTQRMGGIVLMVMGVAFLACAVTTALGLGGLDTWVLAVVVVGVAWMYAYSYLVWRRRVR